MRKILFALVFMLMVATPVRAELATTSAITKTDITQSTLEVKGKLEKVLDDNPAGPLSWKNFFRHAAGSAVEHGVPVNTVVLILLFPLVVAIVAASRHLVGMRGVGILTPALLSVALLATGVWSGVLLFLVILLVTTSARILLKRLKMQYLPRLALLLWTVSGAVFLALWERQCCHYLAWLPWGFSQF